MNFYSSVSDFQPKKGEMKGYGLMLAIARISHLQMGKLLKVSREFIISNIYHCYEGCLNFAAETNELKMSQWRKMFELSNVLNVQMLYFYQFVFWTFYIKSDRIQAME